MAKIASQKTLAFVTSLDGHQNMHYSWQYFSQKPSQRYDSETQSGLEFATCALAYARVSNDNQTLDPQSGSVRYVELLQTQRQKVPALKAAIEDLKAGRLQAGWEKVEHYGVIKEVTNDSEMRGRAIDQHLEALRAGKTSLIISFRHAEARKVAAVVRQQLKAEGAIGPEDHAVTVLRRMDLGPEACRDPLHYAAGRVVGFHSRTAGGFRPGEKWTVRETNCETVTLERNAEVRQFNAFPFEPGDRHRLEYSSELLTKFCIYI